MPDGVRTVTNPDGPTGPTIIVGGVELEAALESEQISGQDAPDKPIEEGAEITQRNVLEPEEGTIRAAADSSQVAEIRQLASEPDPIRITTSEGSLDDCIVDSVTRVREGRHIDKFDVDIDWREIQIAEVGEADIQATTDDGDASAEADSSSTSDQVGSDSSESSGDGNGGVMGHLNELGSDIGDFVSGDW